MSGILRSSAFVVLSTIDICCLGMGRMRPVSPATPQFSALSRADARCRLNPAAGFPALITSPNWNKRHLASFSDEPAVEAVNAMQIVTITSFNDFLHSKRSDSHARGIAGQTFRSHCLSAKQLLFWHMRHVWQTKSINILKLPNQPSYPQ